MVIDINTECEKVAGRIQHYRVEKNMSQMTLALEAEISQGFLAMIESNKKIPTIATIFKIANALNIHPSALLQEEQEEREIIKKKIIQMIEKEL